MFGIAMLPTDPLKIEEYRKKLSDKAKIRTGDKNSFFGKKHSKESIDYMKQKHSERGDEWREKQRVSQSGKVASDETKRKMSIARKGKPRSIDIKNKISESKKGVPSHPNSMSALNSPEVKLKRDLVMQTPEYKQKQRVAQSGEKCHMWKGGISFEPYCPKFNNGLKERVRLFFDNKCVECGGTELKLCVHHVHYDKNVCCNDKPPMFVTLCKSCHGKSNKNREYWRAHFEDMINTKYNGKSYFTIEESLK